jgi:hypothetical protein
VGHIRGDKGVRNDGKESTPNCVPPRRRIEIYFRMFSPYALARLNGAAEVTEMFDIEGSLHSATYDRSPRRGSEQFERRTLFYDRSVYDQPSWKTIGALRAALDDANPEAVRHRMVPHRRPYHVVLVARAHKTRNHYVRIHCLGRSKGGLA